MAKDRDVSIKTKAVMTVNLLRKFAGPRLPKTVWLEPPNAAPISAPLPDCSRIAPIMSRQTITWMMISKVYMLRLGRGRLGPERDRDECSKTGGV